MSRPPGRLDCEGGLGGQQGGGREDSQDITRQSNTSRRILMLQLGIAQDQTLMYLVSFSGEHLPCGRESNLCARLAPGESIVNDIGDSRYVLYTVDCCIELH